MSFALSPVKQGLGQAESHAAQLPGPKVNREMVHLSSSSHLPGPGMRGYRTRLRGDSVPPFPGPSFITVPPPSTVCPGSPLLSSGKTRGVVGPGEMPRVCFGGLLLAQLGGVEIACRDSPRSQSLEKPAVCARGTSGKDVNACGVRGHPFQSTPLVLQRGSQYLEKAPHPTQPPAGEGGRQAQRGNLLPLFSPGFFSALPTPHV